MNGHRYRCTSCGNLTRFDVTETRTTRSYVHFSLGGSARIEESEILSADVSDVRCRWCGAGLGVVVVEPTDADTAADSSDTSAGTETTAAADSATAAGSVDADAGA
jgi:hypothetical protein